VKDFVKNPLPASLPDALLEKLRRVETATDRVAVVAQMMRDPAKAMKLNDVKPGQGL